MPLRFSRRRPAAPPRRPAMVLNRATLRAFIHGGRIGPPRAAILRCPPAELARALVDLRSEEAARFLSLVPAAHQIAIITALDPATRARLARDCQDWRCIVPLLTAAPAGKADDGAGMDAEMSVSPLAAHQRSVASWGAPGPLGRY